MVIQVVSISFMSSFCLQTILGMEKGSWPFFVTRYIPDLVKACFPHPFLPPAQELSDAPTPTCYLNQRLSLPCTRTQPECHPNPQGGSGQFFRPQSHGRGGRPSKSYTLGATWQEKMPSLL